MRIRQIALVARELEPVVADLCAVFGLEVAFRDPGVAAFALHNAVMPVGTTFLEVVSPVQEGTTAGRFLEKRGGDGGYMVIFQTVDLAAHRARLATLGVRIAWEIALDDIATLHLHPRDVGGAIVSLDEARPPESWRWAGPGWETHRRTDVVRAIAAVTIAASDPDRLAARWAEVLDLPSPRDRELVLDPGVVHFVDAGERGDGLVAVELSANDPGRALAAARERGLRAEDDHVWIGGVRWHLRG